MHRPGDVVSCRRECDCESEEAHEAAVDEMERDFLRNPGPPPAHMSREAVARAMASTDKRRVALGVRS